MMGQEPPPQEKLFYTGITLDKRVRKNHPLRGINAAIDFEFIYNEVKKAHPETTFIVNPDRQRLMEK